MSTLKTGTNLVVMIDNSVGTLTTVTNVVDALVTDNYNKADSKSHTEMGSLAAQHVSHVELDFEWDSNSTSGNAQLFAAIYGSSNPISVEVRKFGTGSGLPVYKSEMWLMQYYPTNITRDGIVTGKAIFDHHANATDTPAWTAQ